MTDICSPPVMVYHSAWIVQGPSEQTRLGELPPVVKLLALPPAGFGACYFAGWGDRLPRSIEVLPVELPGRNTRAREAKPQPDLHALVRELASGVTTALVPDVTCLLPAPPYAILGHSFGAWLAFELALELRRRGLPPPVKLYVSANRPPCLASPEHDPDPLGPSISTLPPAHFWPRFEGRYGANPDIKSPAVRAFLYPLLCADFAVIENYRGPPPSEAPLTCSLAAIGAHGDGRYRPEQLDAWRGHTSGCFEKRWFTAKVVNDWATPHRFMIDEPSEFQEWLSEDLLRAAAAVNAHE